MRGTSSKGRTNGLLLHPVDRKYVLNAYVHRMTVENARRHREYAYGQLRGGFRMSVLTDEQWLASTLFVTRKDGRLDTRVHSCENNHREVLSPKAAFAVWEAAINGAA